MRFRLANVEDAEQVASVLCRSIRELCTADHGDDESTIEIWLNNKTPEIVKSWINAPDHFVVVAEDLSTILGVGAASHAGEITLNYVAPEARFKGISKSILSLLEGRLRELGLMQSTLTSTQTALSFYTSLGYMETGSPAIWGKLIGHPMTKSI